MAMSPVSLSLSPRHSVRHAERLTVAIAAGAHRHAVENDAFHAEAPRRVDFGAGRCLAAEAAARPSPP